MDILTRFTRRYTVRLDTKCWEWTGAQHKGWYGKFNFDHQQTEAHRAAWQMFRGPIPSGMLVLHSCDNPKCVNPDHLFLGTHADNAHDRDSKGRGAHQKAGWTSPSKGRGVSYVNAFGRRVVGGRTCVECGSAMEQAHNSARLGKPPVCSKKCKFIRLGRLNANRSIRNSVN